MALAPPNPVHVLGRSEVASPEFQAFESEDLFLILDGARMDDAPRFIYEYDDRPEMDFLYRGTPHEPAREVSPCIVRPSGNSRLREDMSKWRSYGVAIEAATDLLSLGNHLRSLISVRLPDGAFAYLRFYSPGQIEALLTSFSEPELVRFSGPVTRWHYYAPAEGWKTIGVPDPGESRTASDEGWFQLTDEHLHSLEQGNEASFRRKLVHQAGWPLTSESLSRIEQIVERARSFGFQAQKDIATYAELACHYGVRLEEPKAITVLQSEDKPAGERLAVIDSMMSYGDA